MAGDKYFPAMLGGLLRAARKTAGLTQEDLAYQAGIDRSYLSQLERDLKSPTVQMLFRICAAMQVSPTSLIAELERRQPSASPRNRR